MVPKKLQIEVSNFMRMAKKAKNSKNFMRKAKNSVKKAENSVKKAENSVKKAKNSAKKAENLTKNWMNSMMRARNTKDSKTLAENSQVKCIYRSKIWANNSFQPSSLVSPSLEVSVFKKLDDWTAVH
jgi:hypothetical protein